MNTHSQRRLGLEALEARRLLAVEVLVTGSGETLDLPLTQLCDVSKVDICGCGDNTVVLNAEWVSESCVDNALRIISDPGDQIELTDTGWKFENAYVEEGSIVRDFTSGEATLQMVGPNDFTNPLNCNDVNGNSEATPWDALLVLNEVRIRQFSDGEDGSPVAPTAMPLGEFSFFDVNGNGKITSLDALCALNDLGKVENAVESQVAETPELLAPADVLAGPLVIPQTISRSETSIETLDEEVKLIETSLGAPSKSSVSAEIEPLLYVPSEDEPSSGLDSTLVDELMLDSDLGVCVEEPCIG